MLKGTIIASGKLDFDKAKKDYFVNMENTMRTLHKTNCCPNSTFAYKFIPFDSLEEAEIYEQNNKVIFRKCLNCFPNQ